MLKTLVASLETSKTWHNSSHTYRLPLEIFFAAAAIEELSGHEHARLVTASSTHPDARGFHRIGVLTLPQILETPICHVSSTRLSNHQASVDPTCPLAFRSMVSTTGDCLVNILYR